MIPLLFEMVYFQGLLLLNFQGVNGGALNGDFHPMGSNPQEIAN